MFFVILKLCLFIASTFAQDYGTFESPSALSRPRFRYWLPDASVDAETVKGDIENAGKIGAGGVEFLPFYNYGGEVGGAPNGSNFRFGTPAFNDLFVAALQAHRDNGLLMDFALGPNQGQGVPADKDDDGLQWDLVPYSASIAPGQGFHDVMPGWGTGELIGAAAAAVISETNVTLNNPPSAFLVTADWYLSIVVRNDTIQDLTDIVNRSTGKLDVDFPGDEAANSHRLFAMYQKRTENHNLIPAQEPPLSIFDDGSYTVDHFDARGAQTVIDFWENYILVDGVKELLSDVGQCGWEDSMELLSNVSWSRTIMSRFSKIHGYDLRPYLPLLLHGNNNINIQSGNPGTYQVLLDTPDQGAGYINDFRVALANGYQEYLDALVNWTHSSLNLTFSSQVSYNLPMDMEASIPFVDIPECESLQFRDSVDGYRQFSGTAYLAGRDIVSIEIGAVFGLAYQYTLPDLLFSAARALSGGVNRLVIHGQSFSGNYADTTWPGYTAFGYQVSDLYSDKQPYWEHGLQDALGYISRLQYLQRQGIAKLDLAIFNLQSATDPTVHTLYTRDDLARAGWTYGYVSPKNFDLPQASISNATLGQNGPGFKAMIVPAEQNMTLQSVAALTKYANEGFPIILLDDEAGYYPSRDGRDRSAIDNALKVLANTANVQSVAADQLLPALQDLDLTPNTKTQCNGTWWTTWREDASSGTDYAFVFSDTNATTGAITVETTKTPYIFDAWTGFTTPVAEYVVDSGSTTIALSLAGNETVTIAFAESQTIANGPLADHVVEATAGILGYTVSSNNSLIARVPAGSSGEIKLASGRTIAVDTADLPPPFALNNWTLIAEHWEAPADLNDAATIAIKHNTTHELPQLVSWTDIPELVNASGVGYYHATLSWPLSAAAMDSLGAYIEFPPVLNAMTVYINGQRYPALNYAKPMVDISQYLITGENVITAVVPTTMLNYLGSIQGELRNAGSNVSIAGKSQNGLIGVVNVIPFRSIAI